MTTPTETELRAELERVKIELSEVMPGAWICEKCGFILQKNVLHTADGTISANVADHCEGCPNDGTAMRALTWREANKSLFDRAVTEIERANKLQVELERVQKQCAEMGEALLSMRIALSKHMPLAEPALEPAWIESDHALSTSSGTGYFSREQVMPLALGLSAVESLINESRGVIGLHLNGDEAAWESLRSTGRYEEWLLDFDKALNHARSIGLLKEDA